MSDYYGPAVVILSDGNEIPVTADLTRTTDSSGMSSWSGSVSDAPDPDDLFDAFDESQLRVRLPNGATGDLIALNHSAGDNWLTVQGSGAPPFS